jgi:hypothetical protein
MKRTISSKLTFFYKFVLPVIWIGLLWPYTIIKIFAHGGGLLMSSCLLLLAVICGSALIFWISAKVKKVEIDYTGKLLISNYRKVIKVKLKDIKNISGSRGLLLIPELVWFSLRKPSELGEKIIFIAMFRGDAGFSIHPIVNELKDLVALTRMNRRESGSGID